MEGGMVYGVGMKGKVMDFEDLDVPDVRSIHFYVGDDMVKKKHFPFYMELLSSHGS